jgi:hypothetical protein
MENKMKTNYRNQPDCDLNLNFWIMEAKRKVKSLNSWETFLGIKIYLQDRFYNKVV